jgi:hypothetical protein
MTTRLDEFQAYRLRVNERILAACSVSTKRSKMLQEAPR